MKNLTILRSILTITIFLLGISATMAQAPANVTAETSTLQQHGNNSLGNPSPAAEATDSLTVGAQNVKYVVYPDLTISPSYNFATSATANLNSSFVWSFTPNTGITINNAVTGFASNYAKVNFPATAGDYALSVRETATSGSCPGTPIGFTVRLITAPTANFDGTPNSSTLCNANPATVSLNLPVALSTAVNSGLVRLTYSIGGANTVAATNINLNESATSFTLPAGTFTAYGTNTITITAVSDHISRKSVVPGVITTSTYSFTIYRVPVTGPIYHIPNM